MNVGVVGLGRPKVGVVRGFGWSNVGVASMVGVLVDVGSAGRNT